MVEQYCCVCRENYQSSLDILTCYAAACDILSIKLSMVPSQASIPLYHLYHYVACTAEELILRQMEFILAELNLTAKSNSSSYEDVQKTKYSKYEEGFFASFRSNRYFQVSGERLL